MSGVPPTIPHPYRAACTGGPYAELGGHRSMWPYKSKPRVRRASPTQQAGVAGANQCRASPKQFRIHTAPRALAVHTRNWVAIEVCGHRSPNHDYGVRPRRDEWVWWVQTNVGRRPQQFRIPTGSRALAVRARNWVAIEVCGDGSPNYGYGVRPRHNKRVWWVQTNVGRPPNDSASLPGRVHWRSVRGIGWA